MSRIRYIAVPIFLVLYLSSYFIISLNEIYRPGCVGLNGIKWYEWMPAGYYSEKLEFRRFMFNIYAPLWMLDQRYWHKESGSFAGPKDNRVNFKGKIITLK